MEKKIRPFSAEHAACYDENSKNADWLAPDISFGMAYRHTFPGQSILDVGIGTGLSSELFHKAGLDVFGMDNSDEMLKVCEKKKKTVFLVQQDLQTPPYPFSDESMNHAVCTGVAHMFHDLGPLFGELSRIIKPGGTLTLVVAHGEDGGESTRFIPPNKHHPKGVRLCLHSPQTLGHLCAEHSFSSAARLLFTSSSIGRRPSDFMCHVLQRDEA
jgi:ubiquinone/menaquinone biosynthesis C-methylase UbiE